MKKILSVLAAAAVLGTMLVSCGEESVEDNVYIPIRTGNVINYETAHAIVGTLKEEVTLQGTVTMPYTMDLSFTRIGGTLASVDVRQDQEVAKGDVIAVLKSDDLEEQITVQKIKLDSAQALYETLQSQHADANDIEFARIDYEIEKGEYDALVENREYLTLRAPFDGKITSVRNYRGGSYIDVNTPVCTISDSSRYRLTVPDYNGQLSNVSFGMKVDIVQGAIISTTGKVVDMITSETPRGWGDWAMMGGGDMPSEYISYIIQTDEDVTFSELGGVDVTFTTLRRDDAVIVPTSAIYEATDAGNVTSNYVNVLMNGIKVQTPVTVGVISGERAEILNGLEGNETLILK